MEAQEYQDEIHPAVLQLCPSSGLPQAASALQFVAVFKAFVQISHKRDIEQMRCQQSK